MNEKSFCRIGVFYDGSYFSYAQEYLAHNRKLGWLDFQPFHSLIENYIRAQEQGYTNYKVVYAAWFQGLFTSTRADEQQLRRERNRYHDLMHAGIEPKYFPMSMSQGEKGVEKGVDVALAIDALQVGLDRRIDIAVLVTGDGDLVPLVRTLMKQGIRVMAVYFKYEEGEYKGYINERLLRVCNYSLNFNALEEDRTDRTKMATFRGLFRKPDEQA